MPVFGNSHVGERQRSNNVWATPTSTQGIGMLTRLKRMTGTWWKRGKKLPDLLLQPSVVLWSIEPFWGPKGGSAKDPAVPKILRDSELLRRSVFTTPPKLTTPWTPHIAGENACKTQQTCSENSRRLWLSEIPCWKSFPATFDAAGKFFTDFPAAIPAKVWAFSGKENGCWKIPAPVGTLLDFLLRDRHSLLEFFWLVSAQEGSP